MIEGRIAMLCRNALGAMALAAALLIPMVGANAFDDAKYPDFSGQWARIGGIQWDPTKPRGRAQQAPLTPEYQAVFEASLADQTAGGQGNDPVAKCIPQGLPRIMTVVFPMEIVITPKTTHILFDYALPRRIYTDGRTWPKDVEASFLGYSIGTWVGDIGGGPYEALEIETRALKGPRAYDDSGLPFHQDDETIVKERIFLDKANPNLLHDEVTTIDHALTRPWTVTKNYRRVPNPIWFQNNCAEDNRHVSVGKEDYFISGDDFLMPAKKGQPAPDLKYFKPAQK
jgi:hypothetical protein